MPVDASPANPADDTPPFPRNHTPPPRRPQAVTSFTWGDCCGQQARGQAGLTDASADTAAASADAGEYPRQPTTAVVAVEEEHHSPL